MPIYLHFKFFLLCSSYTLCLFNQLCGFNNIPSCPGLSLHTHTFLIHSRRYLPSLPVPPQSSYESPVSLCLPRLCEFIFTTKRGRCLKYIQRWMDGESNPLYPSLFMICHPYISLYFKCYDSSSHIHVQLLCIPWNGQLIQIAYAMSWLTLPEDNEKHNNCYTTHDSTRFTAKSIDLSRPHC